MNRNQILALLGQNKSLLAKTYGVKDIALFGSAVRNTSKPGSDIDILVEFDGPATSDRYFGVQFFLEDLLGASIDLVTEKALRTELRPFIAREAVHV